MTAKLVHHNPKPSIRLTQEEWKDLYDAFCGVFFLVQCMENNGVFERLQEIQRDVKARQKQEGGEQ